MSSWQELHKTLELLHHHAISQVPEAPARMEATVAELGRIAAALKDQGPPDNTTFLLIHAAISRLGKALPNERELIREKITNLITRAQAQKAYIRRANSSGA